MPMLLDMSLRVVYFPPRTSSENANANANPNLMLMLSQRVFANTLMPLPSLFTDICLYIHIPPLECSEAPNAIAPAAAAALRE
jgi:hypothetical protein